MNSVEITGRINNRNISIHRSLPDKWDEFTLKHLDDLAEVLVSGQPEEKHPRMILYKWLDLPQEVFFNLDGLYIEKLSERLRFMFERNTLSKVLMPQFNHQSVTYYGPKDKFVNISLFEWVIGENCMQKYQQTKSDADLNTIVYTMYRPLRTDITEDSMEYKGDLRELINDHTIDKKAQVFKDLPKKEKMKALITFIGNRNTVMQLFEPVFADVQRKGIADPYSWSGILVDMTGSKWQTREAVEREKVYNTFIHWHQNILRMEEYEMEVENSKR